MNLKSQIALEYLIIIGFLTFVIIMILGISLIYGNSIQDKLKINQLENCANKIISTSESLFYKGRPSKASIVCYIPENVKNTTIIENSIVFTIYTSSGESIIQYNSNVPLKSTSQLFTNGGAKNLKIEVEETSPGNDEVVITPL